MLRPSLQRDLQCQYRLQHRKLDLTLAQSNEQRGSVRPTRTNGVCLVTMGGFIVIYFSMLLTYPLRRDEEKSKATAIVPPGKRVRPEIMGNKVISPQYRHQEQFTEKRRLRSQAASPQGILSKTRSLSNGCKNGSLRHKASIPGLLH